jgi:hypothetical protein
MPTDYRTCMQGNRIIINIHVPKTAGTTFGSRMRKVLLSLGRADLFTNIYCNPSLNPNESPKETYIESLIRKLTMCLEQLAPDRPAFVTGHYRLQDIAPVIATYGDRIELVTFLRDPVERSISDYYFSLSVKNDNHMNFKQNYPTLTDFLGCHDCVNKHMLHLRPHSGATVEETVDYLCERFYFIGQTANFDDDFDRLCNMLGLPHVPPMQLNVNPDRARDHAAVLLAKVAEAAATDIAMFEAITTRLETKRISSSTTNDTSI